MLTASTYTHYLLFIIPWISTLIALGIFYSISLNNMFNKLVLNIYSFLCFLLGFLLSLISLYSIFFEIQILDLNIIIKYNFNFGIFLFISHLKFFWFLKMIKNCLILLDYHCYKYFFLVFFLVSTIGNPNNEFKKFINFNNTDKNKVFAIESNSE